MILKKKIMRPMDYGQYPTPTSLDDDTMILQMANLVISSYCLNFITILMIIIFENVNFVSALDQESMNYMGDREMWLLKYGYYRNYALQIPHKHCVMPILTRKIEDNDKPLKDYFCNWYV